MFRMWLQVSEDKTVWQLMSHLIQSIQKLLEVQAMVLPELDMQEGLPKEYVSVIALVSISIAGISGMLQKLVQELLVLQQVQDSDLAIKLGEA